MGVADFGVPGVGAGRCRVEHDRDVVEARHLNEAVDAVRGDRHAKPPGAGEPIGFGIDPDERGPGNSEGRERALAAFIKVGKELELIK